MFEITFTRILPHACKWILEVISRVAYKFHGNIRYVSLEHIERVRVKRLSSSQSVDGEILIVLRIKFPIFELRAIIADTPVVAGDGEKEGNAISMRKIVVNCVSRLMAPIC